MFWTWGSLYGKQYFLFSNALKKLPFKKSCTGIWSFLYYQQRQYFLFTKIWPYSLDGKWKIIFPKKYMKIWYFLIFGKDGIPFSYKYYIIFLSKKWRLPPPDKIHLKIENMIYLLIEKLKKIKKFTFRNIFHWFSVPLQRPL